ncbi:MAG: hypothetical protein ACI3YI_05370 [Bacteroidaceae bacterium]
MKKIILFALLLSFPIILDSCKRKDPEQAAQDALNDVFELQRKEKEQTERKADSLMRLLR